MMASDERKLATSSLVSLEIDAASILSLSKGVIFDTIIHNVEYTFNNRRTDSLPWKLTGMSLICDPVKNAKYMHKLQKMQCVPSVICTQIYHSKLVKTESGVLTTPGRRITIPTAPRKRLTGVIVCRSIDELLYMETSNAENIHFIQYKLLAYERLATRELVNGPKLSSIGDKIIKTVFDFELTQQNGFPRQLLPVAIISFTRQDGCDLCSSIRSFLELDDHKIFDKSYLVTSTNVEFDRLREEQERKEDAEAEQESPWEKIQRRQPLADLSKRSTDTGNAQPPLRVAPLKLKLSRPEKPLKPSVSIPSLDSKFRCSLKLDRINLSSYDISNLASLPQIKTKKLNESSTSSLDSINNKTKSFTITKQHEHHKPLKRLNTSETKKQSPPLLETSKKNRNNGSVSSRSSTSDVMTSLTKDKTKQRSISSSSLSPIYRPVSLIRKQPVEKTVTKKVVKRPVLPPEYRCSISLPRIDLSMYNIDLPIVTTPVDNLPMNMESTMTTSPSNSSSSSEQRTELSNLPSESNNIQDTIQPMLVVEEDNDDDEFEVPNIFDAQQFDDTNINESFPNIMDEFLTPEMNESLSTTNNEVLPPSTDEISLQAPSESVPTITDEVCSAPVNESLPQVTTEATSEILPTTIDEVLPDITNEVHMETTSEVPSPATNDFLFETANDTLLPATNEVVPVISNEENTQPSSPIPCVAFSPELPPLDDDPVLFSVESPQMSVADNSDAIPQDYIIIVPCSDDDDDYYDDEIHDTKNISITDDKTNQLVESLSSPNDINASPRLHNPLLARILTNDSRSNSDRLSISSSSSSCSSISTSILHNQSPRSPLHLTEIFISQKILKKQQCKSPQTITFTRFNTSIPLFTHEPLIDPRLIYRLQAITTDLRWPNPCNQCSISAQLPPVFTSSTQTISYDRKCPSEYVDPRRESLKNAILHSIYQRIRILIPNIFIVNSNQFQKLLFEQTIFTTNCSLHLEYLLHKIKIIDDMNFFHTIKTNDEFQLSPFLLQLIFN